MYALFINMSVRNWHFATEGGIAMSFLIEPVYCMTWIWTLHRAHNKLKSPIKEDNIWVSNRQDTIKFSMRHLVGPLLHRKQTE